MTTNDHKPPTNKTQTITNLQQTTRNHQQMTTNYQQINTSYKRPQTSIPVHQIKNFTFHFFFPQLKSKHDYYNNDNIRLLMTFESGV